MEKNKVFRLSEYNDYVPDFSVYEPFVVSGGGSCNVQAVLCVQYT